MTTTQNQLPADLPVPIDDGAAAHLEGALLPDVSPALSEFIMQSSHRWTREFSGSACKELPTNEKSAPGYIYRSTSSVTKTWL